MPASSFEDSPRNRVLSAIAGGKVGRIPVTAVCQTATYDQMKIVGVSWPEAHFDAGKMARLAEAAHELTGLETAKVPFDQAVEAEALGALMEFKQDMPTITRHAFPKLAALKIPEDFTDRKRVPVVLKSVEMIHEHVGHFLPVVASIVGPVTLATMTFGYAQTLKAMIESPDEMSSATTDLSRLLTNYATDLVRFGADVIVIEDMFSSQIGPRMFEKYAMQPLIQLISAIKSVVVLHICGNATPILSHMVDTGADAISIEKKTDLEVAVRAAKGRASVIGNIDPVRTLLEGSFSDIENAVRMAIHAGINAIAPGCSIAPRTSLDHIRCMVNSARPVAPH